jgi:HSP20 family protein
MNRRDPFTDVEELVERVDQELGKIGASFELPGGRRMPVDVVDGPDAVTVAADLPGYEEESITVEFDDDVLTITATPANDGASIGDPETAEATHDDGEATHHDGEAAHDGESPSGDERTYQIRERRHGSVSRRVPVGATVDAAGATAAYDAGVLTVTLPKRSAADTHRIDVE